MRKETTVTVLFIVPFILIGLVLSVHSEGWDYSSMYDEETLRLHEPEVANLVRDSFTRIGASLSQEDRNKGTYVRVQLPLRSKSLVGFGSDPRAKVISVPVSSVLFIIELEMTSSWFMLERGCNPRMGSDYVGMLHYQPETAILGGPAEVFSLPTVGHDLWNYEVDFQQRAWKIIVSIVHFVLAHELGHVLNDHRPYSEITLEKAIAQEVEADRFAIEFFRRTERSLPPVALYFNILSRLSPVRSDFKTQADYDNALHKRTHPLNSYRINSIVTFIRRNIDDLERSYFSLKDARTTLMKVADAFSSHATSLDDEILQEKRKRRAQEMTVEELTLCEPLKKMN